MKTTAFTRSALETRRERRRMIAKGYCYNELDWRIHRGALYRETVVDVKIAADGKGVWYRLSNDPDADGRAKDPKNYDRLKHERDLELTEQVRSRLFLLKHARAM